MISNLDQNVPKSSFLTTITASQMPHNVMIDEDIQIEIGQLKL